METKMKHYVEDYNKIVSKPLWRIPTNMYKKGYENLMIHIICHYKVKPKTYNDLYKLTLFLENQTVIFLYLSQLS